jgi:hypothetical protein
MTNSSNTISQTISDKIQFHIEFDPTNHLTNQPFGAIGNSRCGKGEKIPENSIKM